MAERLCDVDAVEAAAYQGYGSIRSRGLAGYAGITLLFSALVNLQDNQRYRDALFCYMRRAAQFEGHTSSGLFSGIAGIIAACTYASEIEPRYLALRDKCCLILDPSSLYGRTQPAHSYSDYDLIAGIAGYILALPLDAEIQIRAGCEYIAWLLDDDSRWLCPHPIRTDDGPQHDLGMAHGLAGMVAALTLCAPAEGRFIRAIERGVEHLASWLDPDLGWPCAIINQKPRYGRHAWCYGTPGCAMALLMSSQRLCNATLQKKALEALKKLARLPLKHWPLDDYAICHGVSGAALVYGFASEVTSDSNLRLHSLEFLDQILDEWNENAMFGYQSASQDGLVDAGGLLEGASGIGLTMLTLVGDCDDGWLRYFGMGHIRG